MIYKVSTNVGIGDIIYAKTILDQLSPRYDEIHICTNNKAYESRMPVRDEILEWDSYLHNKNIEEYRDFVAKLFAWIFTEPYYRVNLDSEYPHKTILELCGEHRIKPVKPNLKRYLWNHTTEVPGDYVVVQTKSRMFNYGEMCVTGDKIWDAIARLSEKYKIVIMGERAIEPNHEYSAGFSEASGAYSMYSEAMNHLPSRNIIDLTVPALGLTSPDFDKFRHDCHIISKAKASLSFGFGGGFCMAMAFGKTLCYKNYDNEETSFLFPKDNIEDSLVTGNQDTFIDALERL